jgi:hypothetical protein
VHFTGGLKMEILDSYSIGQSVEVEVAFSDPGPADSPFETPVEWAPPVVKVRVQEPNAAEVKYEAGADGTPITSPSTGVYRYLLRFNAPGIWVVQFQAYEEDGVTPIAAGELYVFQIAQVPFSGAL